MLLTIALTCSVVLAGLPSLDGSPGGSAVFAQDPPPALQDVLKKRLGNHVDKYFTGDQISELEQLIALKTSGISDPALKAKVVGDAMEYVVRQAASNVFVGVDPLKQGEEQVQISRSPASWELYKYELEHRLDLVPSNGKSPEDIAKIEAQIDSLGQTAKSRLYDIFVGPEGPNYVNSVVDRWKESLRYYASSNLEFLLSKPLTNQEFKDLEFVLSSYVPDKTLDPAYAKNPNQVVIKDLKDVPYRALSLTTFGVFRKAKEFLYGISQREDFYDAKYKQLRAAMEREFEDKEKAFQAESPKLAPPKEGREAVESGRRAGSDAGGPGAAAQPRSTTSTGSPEGLPSDQHLKQRAIGMLSLLAGATLLGYFAMKRARKPA